MCCRLAHGDLGWACVCCLLFLAGGCRFHDEAFPSQDGWITDEMKKHPERWPTEKQVKLVAQVRERLPSLKPGMTEAQVKKVLTELPLGEGTVVSRTISGGETVQYALSLRYDLELTFIPRSLSEQPPGGLTEARLIDRYP
jgi:hypothetical protein